MPGGEPPGKQHGTQSVERVLRVLEAVLDHAQTGVRSVEVARLIGVPDATAHRHLKALLRARMVSFDGYQKKYFLGGRLAELSAASHQRRLPEWVEAARLVADLTEDTVYLYARSGPEIVCVDRIEGVHPVKALIPGVGSRIPIGANSGSTHMLACMAEEEASRVLYLNEERLALFRRLTVEELRAEMRSAAVRGFGVNDNRAMEGVAAVGVALLDPAGAPVGCLCVSAQTQRLDTTRRPQVARQIMDVCARLGIAYGRARRPAPPPSRSRL